MSKELPSSFRKKVTKYGSGVIVAAMLGGGIGLGVKYLADHPVYPDNDYPISQRYNPGPLTTEKFLTTSTKASTNSTVESTTPTTQANEFNINKDQPISGALYDLDFKKQAEEAFKEKGLLGNYLLDSASLTLVHNFDGTDSTAMPYINLSWGQKIDQDSLDTNIYNEARQDRKLYEYDPVTKGPFKRGFYMVEIDNIKIIPDGEVSHISFQTSYEQFRILKDDSEIGKVPGSPDDLLRKELDRFEKGYSSYIFPEVTLYLNKQTYQEIFWEVDLLSSFKNKTWEPSEWTSVYSKPQKTTLNEYQSQTLTDLREKLNGFSFNLDDATKVWEMFEVYSYSRIKNIEFIQKKVNGVEGKFARITWFGTRIDEKTNEPVPSSQEFSADVPYESVRILVDSYDPEEKDTPYLKYYQDHNIKLDPKKAVKNALKTKNVNDLFINTGFEIDVHLTPEEAMGFGLVAK